MRVEKKTDDRRYHLAYQRREAAGNYRRIYGDRLNIRNTSSKAVAFRERSIVKRILRICRSQNKGLLDIPCGAGKLSSICSDYPVVGADISMAMMSIAREFYPLSTHFRGFVAADVSGIPFKSGAFETVICLRLLHRVPPQDWATILRELAEVSQHYVIISYGLAGKHTRVRALLKRVLGKGTSSFSLYLTTPDEIGGKIESAGLEAVRSFRVFPFIYHEIIALLRKRSN
jgi:2-polyprenyl-3-methyl-5-hydroxy-6-metoxy-1,4-benzoquinol methylase